MREQAGRAKLLSAAASLFVERGYHQTSVSQIAAKAGVSKGLTYRYFESKEALLVQVLEATTGRMIAMSTDGGAGEDHAARLGLLLDALEQLLASGAAQLQFELGLLFQPDLRDVVLPAMQRRAEALLAAAEGMFHDAGVAEARQVARRFLTELDGIALHSFGVFASFPLTEMLAQVRRNYAEVPR